MTMFDRRTVLTAGAGFAMLAACRRPAGRVRLVLGDQMNIQRAKMEAAGVLDGLGYALEWANFPGAAPLFEALNAGAVDTAPAADLPIAAAAVGGVRLKIPAVSRFAPEGFAVVMPGGSPIHKVADLVGRSVIVSSARGSITHFMLLEALREAGVAAGQVRIGFMLPTDAASAFATGRIDAWVTFGVYLVRAELGGARVLRNAAGLCPGYGGIAAAAPALEDPARRAALADVFHRMRRASEWAGRNLDAYARVYGQRTGVDPQIARTLVQREHPALFSPDRRFVADLQQATDRFVGYGVYPHSVDIAALVDTTLLAG